MLGPWRVLPDRNRLIGPGGVRTLEPMGMRLLLLLAQRAPQTVMREEMIDVLWQGRIVTDDAVNKQISKVRAAVADPRDGKSLVETVPKVGVRLISPPRKPELVKKFHHWRFAVATAVSLALVGWLTTRQRTFQVIEDPITSSPGAEVDPALSADGRMLAYVAKRDATSHALLFIRAVDSDSPRAMSAHDSDAGAPAWSPDGSLAYVSRRSSTCEIVVRTASGKYFPSLGCIEANVGGLSWLNEHTLIVSDRPGIGQSYRLWLWKPGTGARRQLTDPSAGDIGDLHPVAARDSSAIYFIRNQTVGTASLYQLRMENGAAEPLSPSSTVVTRVALGPRNSLILSAQHGREGAALWRFERGDHWTKLMPTPAPYLSGSLDGRSFVYSRLEKQTVLWQLPLSGKGAGRSLFPSTQADWSPVASPDTTKLAFLSDRSGSEEIWLLDIASGRARRVSHFGGPSIQDLAWSPDSRSLLTSVPNGGQFDVVELEVASGKSRSLIATRADERHAIFANNGSIDFVRRTGARYVLLRRNLRSGTDTPLAASVMRLVPGPTDRLIFTRPFQSGIWIADATGRGARLLAPFPDVVRMRDVAAIGDHVYAVRMEGPVAMLTEIDARNGKHRTIRQLPDIARPSGIAVLRGSVVYARSLRLEADIYRIRLTG